jgi:hypothetical protein
MLQQGFDCGGLTAGRQRGQIAKTVPITPI